MLLESIWARLLKAHTIFSPVDFSGAGRAFNSLKRCEKLIDSIEDKNSLTAHRIKAMIFKLKAWFYMFTSRFDLGLESAKKNLSFTKETGNKMDIARSYGLLANAYWRLGVLGTGLEHAIHYLDIVKELDNPDQTSRSSLLVGNIYSDKGDFNQALHFLNQSLSVKEIGNILKYQVLESLAEVYYRKNDLNKAVEYLNQARKIAQEENYDILLVRCLNPLGLFYYLKGEHDQAIDILELSIEISKRVNFSTLASFFTLFLVYLAKGSREQAQKYLKLLEIPPNNISNIFYERIFKLAKGLMLKTSGRTRIRAEAELLLKECIGSADEPQLQFQSGVTSDLKMFGLVNLCDLYLEDLSLSNDLEVLEDIEPLIKQMIQFADEKHSVIYLAETKLLQAKLALIQLNTTEAAKLLAEAEHIAETHEFDLLAVKISTEHDVLLTQLDVWDDFKEKNAPVSERVKLASFDGVIDRLQRKHSAELPELVDEESTLLLIISEGGVLIFSHSFTDEWERDDELFSSFLTAFSSFSDEFFSEGLDRVKFGKYTVLMGNVGSFSICYLFKGQTYSAKKKLTQFTEGIRNTAAIWQVLQKFFKTSQVLTLKDIPPLESLISEVFMSKA